MRLQDQPGRRRARRAPSSASAGVAHHALALAVVAHAPRLEHRRQAAALERPRAGSRRRRPARRPGTAMPEALEQALLLAAGPAPTASAAGGGCTGTRPARRSAEAAGTFSNSKVTTSRAVGEARRARPGRRTRARTTQVGGRRRRRARRGSSAAAARRAARRPAPACARAGRRRGCRRRRHGAGARGSGSASTASVRRLRRQASSALAELRAPPRHDRRGQQRRR